MSMEYRAIKEFCNVSSSKRIFAEQYVDEGIPFYRQKEIIEKGLHQTIEDPIYITEETYNNIKAKFGVPQNGDLLITAVGVTLGIPYVVDDEVFYFKDGNLIWLSKFDNSVNSKYVYYWFSTSFGHDSIYMRAIGSAQPAITIDIVKKYRLFLPDRQTQDKIVDIMSGYDQAIEKNNKRIKILEQMAENLYKEWFVRFRFPGHEGVKQKESRIGKIPQSFDVLKMKEVFDYYIGGGWGNDDEDKDFSEGAYVIRGTDFPYVLRGDLSTCPYRYHKKSNLSSRELEPYDIIIEVSGGTAEQPVGRAILVGKDVIERLNGSVICASFCKQVRLKKDVINPAYFYYWMKFLYDTRIIDRFQLQSTGIINFKFEYFLNKGDVLMPPKDLMNDFSAFVEQINNEMAIIARQNENLIRQRDLLLPRLMSGKLEVK